MQQLCCVLERADGKLWGSDPFGSRRHWRQDRLGEVCCVDYLVGANESPGDVQPGGVGFGTGVAGAGILEDPWGEILFEGVDGGFEDADVGVDSAYVEVGPAALVDEAGSFGCE